MVGECFAVDGSLCFDPRTPKESWSQKVTKLPISPCGEALQSTVGLIVIAKWGRFGFG